MNDAKHLIQQIFKSRQNGGQCLIFLFFRITICCSYLNLCIKTMCVFIAFFLDNFLKFPKNCPKFFRGAFSKFHNLTWNLYGHPSYTTLNGEEVSVETGVHQGCPIDGSILCITIVPLIKKVNQNIEGSCFITWMTDIM